MKELFKNKTKYSQKEYDMFLRSYQKEYAVSELMYTIFYIVFFVFCLVLAIISKEVILSIALSIGLIIYFWYKFIRPVKKVKKEKNSNKIQKEYITTFKFYKNYFYVQNIEGDAKVFYFKIYRVIETNTHFYIYIARDYAFLISKKGFIDSKTEDFRKFIKKKVFMKYKDRMEK